MTNDNSDADTDHRNDGGSRFSLSPGAAADGAEADDPGVAEEEEDSFNNNSSIPVFLDRTFRMVENVPDEVVCWSDAGDSFIIKQARVREKAECAGDERRAPLLLRLARPRRSCGSQ